MLSGTGQKKDPNPKRVDGKKGKPKKNIKVTVIDLDKANTFIPSESDASFSLPGMVNASPISPPSTPEKRGSSRGSPTLTPEKKDSSKDSPTSTPEKKILLKGSPTISPLLTPGSPIPLVSSPKVDEGKETGEREEVKQEQKDDLQTLHDRAKLLKSEASPLSINIKRLEEAAQKQNFEAAVLKALALAQISCDEKARAVSKDGEVKESKESLLLFVSTKVIKKYISGNWKKKGSKVGQTTEVEKTTQVSSKRAASKTPERISKVIKLAGETKAALGAQRDVVEHYRFGMYELLKTYSDILYLSKEKKEDISTQYNDLKNYLFGFLKQLITEYSTELGNKTLIGKSQRVEFLEGLKPFVESIKYGVGDAPTTISFKLYADQKQTVPWFKTVTVPWLLETMAEVLNNKLNVVFGRQLGRVLPDQLKTLESKSAEMGFEITQQDKTTLIKLKSDKKLVCNQGQLLQDISALNEVIVANQSNFETCKQAVDKLNVDSDAVMTEYQAAVNAVVDEIKADVMKANDRIVGIFSEISKAFEEVTKGKDSGDGQKKHGNDIKIKETRCAAIAELIQNMYLYDAERSTSKQYDKQASKVKKIEQKVGDSYKIIEKARATTRDRLQDAKNALVELNSKVEWAKKKFRVDHFKQYLDAANELIKGLEAYEKRSADVHKDIEDAKKEHEKIIQEFYKGRLRKRDELLRREEFIAKQNTTFKEINEALATLGCITLPEVKAGQLSETEQEQKWVLINAKMLELEKDLIHNCPYQDIKDQTTPGSLRDTLDKRQKTVFIASQNYKLDVVKKTLTKIKAPDKIESKIPDGQGQATSPSQLQSAQSQSAPGEFKRSGEHKEEATSKAHEQEEKQWEIVDKYLQEITDDLKQCAYHELKKPGSKIVTQLNERKDDAYILRQNRQLAQLEEALRFANTANSKIKQALEKIDAANDTSEVKTSEDAQAKIDEIDKQEKAATEAATEFKTWQQAAADCLTKIDQISEARKINKQPAKVEPSEVKQPAEVKQYELVEVEGQAQPEPLPEQSESKPEGGSSSDSPSVDLVHNEIKSSKKRNVECYESGRNFCSKLTSGSIGVIRSQLTEKQGKLLEAERKAEEAAAKLRASEAKEKYDELVKIVCLLTTAIENNLNFWKSKVSRFGSYSKINNIEVPGFIAQTYKRLQEAKISANEVSFEYDHETKKLYDMLEQLSGIARSRDALLGNNWRYNLGIRDPATDKIIKLVSRLVLEKKQGIKEQKDPKEGVVKNSHQVNFTAEKFEEELKKIDGKLVVSNARAEFESYDAEEMQNGCIIRI